jgi:hypothetical protein
MMMTERIAVASYDEHDSCHYDEAMMNMIPATMMNMMMITMIMEMAEANTEMQQR